METSPDRGRPPGDPHIPLGSRPGLVAENLLRGQRPVPEVPEHPRMTGVPQLAAEGGRRDSKDRAPGMCQAGRSDRVVSQSEYQEAQSSSAPSTIRNTRWWVSAASCSRLICSAVSVVSVPR